MARQPVPVGLEMGDWVPLEVGKVASEMYSSLNDPSLRTKDYAAAVKRLTTDRRMRSVWKELSGHRRGSATVREYVHPAVSEAVRSHRINAETRRLTRGLPPVEKVQRQAIVMLFVEAAQLCSWDRKLWAPHVRTIKELREKIRIYRTLGSRILADVQTLRDLGNSSFASALTDAAEDCNRQADGLEAELCQVLRIRSDLIVSRTSSRLGDPWLRAFIILMSGHCSYLFGKRMDGVVATLTNVVFQRTDLTQDNIRGAFRRT
jgi:hypothetical protein